MADEKAGEQLVKPSIDAFMLADQAEAFNGKIYLMGGGFDTIWAPQFPWEAHFAIAALLRVPWADTNRPLSFELWFEDYDGQRIGPTPRGQVEAGRAPGKRGEDTLVAMCSPLRFGSAEPVDLCVHFRFETDVRKANLKFTHAEARPS